MVSHKPFEDTLGASARRKPSGDEVELSKADPEQFRTRPRIGITGSFGRGNYGDELYVKTYQYWMAPWADLFLLAGLPRQPYFSAFAEELVDVTDAVVLGGGDLLCPYRPQIDRDFINPHYLRRPLHVAGIGVERNRPDIDETVVERWKTFLTHDNIRSFSTRDPGSASWIEEHIRPSVEVKHHPDLVCALPLPQAKRPEGPPILGLVTRHIKHPKEYVLVAKVADMLSQKGWRVRHIIGGVGGHGAKDHENAKHMEVPGKEVFYSENLDKISRALGECSLVLSMKLHTTIVSTMYGVPTISVNPVVKARAFMRAVGREDLAIASNDTALFDLVESDTLEPNPEAVSRLREQASNAMRQLSQRIWDDFRASSPYRLRNLPSAPPLPPMRSKNFL